MPLNAQVALSIVAHETSYGDLSRQMRVTPASHSVVLSDGTAANQAQVVWSDSRTLAGGSDTLALSSLADSRDGASVSVNITSVKVIYIKNTHASSSLTFSGGPLTASGVSIAAGGACVITDSTAGGMSSGSISVSGAAGGTYEIVLIGEGSVT